MSTFAVIAICILVLVNFFLALIAGCAIGMLRERKETDEEEFPFDAIIPAIAAAIVMHEKEKKESEGKENKEGTETPEKPAE